MIYAELSQLSVSELLGLRSDAVLLDEMPRAAAPICEMPEQTLLSQTPGHTAIGLTATSVRYLDEQKDTDL